MQEINDIVTEGKFMIGHTPGIAEPWFFGPIPKGTAEDKAPIRFKTFAELYHHTVNNAEIGYLVANNHCLQLADSVINLLKRGIGTGVKKKGVVQYCPHCDKRLDVEDWMKQAHDNPERDKLKDHGIEY